MAIIVRNQKRQTQALKTCGLLGICMLLLTSCTSSPQEQEYLPKNSIGVSSSPAISISPCEQLPTGTFLSSTTYEAGERTYRLIGVAPIEGSDRGIPKDFLEKLSQSAVCFKNDPSVEDKTAIYLFDANERLLNASMIQSGYGRAVTTISYLYKSLFLKLEEEAKKNLRGQWQKDSVISTQPKNELRAPTGPLPLTEVRQYIDVPVTFQFTVESVGRSEYGIYLNTMNDYLHKDNIAIRIPLEGDDRMSMLRGKGESLQKRKVQVSGTVELKDGKMVLTLKKGKDLLILE